MLVVWKLDRLGCNLVHLVNTVQDLSARDVGLRVLTGQGAQIDTSVSELCTQLEIKPMTLYRHVGPQG